MLTSEGGPQPVLTGEGGTQPVLTGRGYTASVDGEGVHSQC